MQDSGTLEATSTCRALVPLAAADDAAQSHAAIRQPASFLAHLIATKQALPQTRERRRIAPEVAAAIYAARACVPASKPHEFARAC